MISLVLAFVYTSFGNQAKLEIVLEDEGSSSDETAADSEGDGDDQMEETESVANDITTEETLVEVHILSETQQWWVG